MSKVSPASGMKFDWTVPVLVIGGGACGLTAALKASDGGAEVVVLERDQAPAGSTAMSSGFIPAAGTRCQLAAGLSEPDEPELFATDIFAKSKGTADEGLVDIATQAIGPAMDWLAEDHGLEWVLLDEFLYPGHARHRMHAVPREDRSGPGRKAFSCRRRGRNRDSDIRTSSRNFLPMAIAFAVSPSNAPMARSSGSAVKR